MSYPLYYAFDRAEPPPRSGAAHATIYPYGPFRTGDGRTVMLGLQNEREWASFCANVIERSELATDERFKSNSLRVARRDELNAIVTEAFSKLTAGELVERLERATIANAAVNDMHDVWQHPQLNARDRWSEVESPSGRIPALFPPGIDRAHAPRMDPIPALGQHTDAILQELGYDPGAIAKLRSDGAI
jgi:itaconate CoA-transferase